jgi:hypothetical protein
LCIQCHYLISVFFSIPAIKYWWSAPTLTRKTRSIFISLIPWDLKHVIVKVWRAVQMSKTDRCKEIQEARKTLALCWIKYTERDKVRINRKNCVQYAKLDKQCKIVFVFPLT